MCNLKINWQSPQRTAQQSTNWLREMAAKKIDLTAEGVRDALFNSALCGMLNGIRCTATQADIKTELDRLAVSRNVLDYLNGDVFANVVALRNTVLSDCLVIMMRDASPFFFPNKKTEDLRYISEMRLFSKLQRQSRRKTYTPVEIASMFYGPFLQDVTLWKALFEDIKKFFSFNLQTCDIFKLRSIASNFGPAIEQAFSEYFYTNINAFFQFLNLFKQEFPEEKSLDNYIRILTFDFLPTYAKIVRNRDIFDEVRTNILGAADAKTAAEFAQSFFAILLNEDLLDALKVILADCIANQDPTARMNANLLSTAKSIMFMQQQLPKLVKRILNLADFPPVHLCPLMPIEAWNNFVIAHIRAFNFATGKPTNDELPVFVYAVVLFLTEEHRFFEIFTESMTFQNTATAIGRFVNVNFLVVSEYLSTLFVDGTFWNEMCKLVESFVWLSTEDMLNFMPFFDIIPWESGISGQKCLLPMRQRFRSFIGANQNSKDFIMKLTTELNFVRNEVGIRQYLSVLLHKLYNNLANDQSNAVVRLNAVQPNVIVVNQLNNVNVFMLTSVDQALIDVFKDDLQNFTSMNALDLQFLSIDGLEAVDFANEIAEMLLLANIFDLPDPRQYHNDAKHILLIMQLKANWKTLLRVLLSMNVNENLLISERIDIFTRLINGNRVIKSIMFGIVNCNIVDTEDKYWDFFMNFFQVRNFSVFVSVINLLNYEQEFVANGQFVTINLLDALRSTRFFEWTPTPQTTDCDLLLFNYGRQHPKLIAFLRDLLRYLRLVHDPSKLIISEGNRVLRIFATSPKQPFTEASRKFFESFCQQECFATLVEAPSPEKFVEQFLERAHSLILHWTELHRSKDASGRSPLDAAYKPRAIGHNSAFELWTCQKKFFTMSNAPPLFYPYARISSVFDKIQLGSGPFVINDTNNLEALLTYTKTLHLASTADFRENLREYWKLSSEAQQCVQILSNYAFLTADDLRANFHASTYFTGINMLGFMTGINVDMAKCLDFFVEFPLVLQVMYRNIVGVRPEFASMSSADRTLFLQRLLTLDFGAKAFDVGSWLFGNGRLLKLISYYRQFTKYIVVGDAAFENLKKGELKKLMLRFFIEDFADFFNENVLRAIDIKDAASDAHPNVFVRLLTKRPLLGFDAAMFEADALADHAVDLAMAFGVIFDRFENCAAEKQSLLLKKMIDSTAAVDFDDLPVAIKNCAIQLPAFNNYAAQRKNFGAFLALLKELMVTIRLRIDAALSNPSIDAFLLRFAEECDARSTTGPYAFYVALKKYVGFAADAQMQSWDDILKTIADCALISGPLRLHTAHQTTQFLKGIGAMFDSAQTAFSRDDWCHQVLANSGELQLFLDQNIANAYLNVRDIFSGKRSSRYISPMRIAGLLPKGVRISDEEFERVTLDKFADYKTFITAVFDLNAKLRTQPSEFIESFFPLIWRNLHGVQSPLARRVSVQKPVLEAIRKARATLFADAAAQSKRDLAINFFAFLTTNVKALIEPLFGGAHKDAFQVHLDMQQALLVKEEPGDVRYIYDKFVTFLRRRLPIAIADFELHEDFGFGTTEEAEISAFFVTFRFGDGTSVHLKYFFDVLFDNFDKLVHIFADDPKMRTFVATFANQLTAEGVRKVACSAFCWKTLFDAVKSVNFTSFQDFAAGKTPLNALSVFGLWSIVQRNTEANFPYALYRQLMKEVVQRLPPATATDPETLNYEGQIERLFKTQSFFATSLEENIFEWKTILQGNATLDKFNEIFGSLKYAIVSQLVHADPRQNLQTLHKLTGLSHAKSTIASIVAKATPFGIVVDFTEAQISNELSRQLTEEVLERIISLFSQFNSIVEVRKASYSELLFDYVTIASHPAAAALFADLPSVKELMCVERSLCPLFVENVLMALVGTEVAGEMFLEFSKFGFRLQNVSNELALASDPLTLYRRKLLDLPVLFGRKVATFSVVDFYELPQTSTYFGNIVVEGTEDFPEAATFSQLYDSLVMAIAQESSFDALKHSPDFLMYFNRINVNDHRTLFVPLLQNVTLVHEIAKILKPTVPLFFGEALCSLLRQTYGMNFGVEEVYHSFDVNTYKTIISHLKDFRLSDHSTLEPKAIIDVLFTHFPKFYAILAADVDVRENLQQMSAAFGMSSAAYSLIQKTFLSAETWKRYVAQLNAAKFRTFADFSLAKDWSFYVDPFGLMSRLSPPLRVSFAQMQRFVEHVAEQLPRDADYTAIIIKTLSVESTFYARHEGRLAEWRSILSGAGSDIEECIEVFLREIADRIVSELCSSPAENVITIFKLASEKNVVEEIVEKSLVFLQPAGVTIVLQDAWKASKVIGELLATELSTDVLREIEKMVVDVTLRSFGDFLECLFAFVSRHDIRDVCEEDGCMSRYLQSIKGFASEQSCEDFALIFVLPLLQKTLVHEVLLIASLHGISVEALHDFEFEAIDALARFRMKLIGSPTIFGLVFDENWARDVFQVAQVPRPAADLQFLCLKLKNGTEVVFFKLVDQLTVFLQEARAATLLFENMSQFDEIYASIASVAAEDAVASPNGLKRLLSPFLIDADFLRSVFGHVAEMFASLEDFAAGIPYSVGGYFIDAIATLIDVNQDIFGFKIPAHVRDELSKSILLQQLSPQIDVIVVAINKFVAKTLLTHEQFIDKALSLIEADSSSILTEELREKLAATENIVDSIERAIACLRLFLTPENWELRFEATLQHISLEEIAVLLFKMFVGKHSNILRVANDKNLHQLIATTVAQYFGPSPADKMDAVASVIQKFSMRCNASNIHEFVSAVEYILKASIYRDAIAPALGSDASSWELAANATETEIIDVCVRLFDCQLWKRIVEAIETSFHFYPASCMFKLLKK